MKIGSHESAQLNLAVRIVEDAWGELSRSFFVQRQLGETPSRLPDLSFEGTQRRSAVGHSLLRRLDALDRSTLPHDLELTVRLVRFRAQTWAREVDWYWTVLDPLGIGFFGLFLPTAYCGGWLLSNVHGQLAAFPFHESGDEDRYLGLVADYARLIDEFTARTAGQAERGIRMPKVQVKQARSLLTQFKAGLRMVIGVAPERIAGDEHVALARELESRIVKHIEPAFDRALAGLSDAYLALAPDKVGLGQYDGGAQVYAELVKFHTTQDLTPEQIHAQGHERIETIERQMRDVRAELGFEHDAAGFVAHLNRDAHWRASTAEDVTAVFNRYIERMKPRLTECFSTGPRAPYKVSPLPEALEGAMTYGYYDAPGKDRPEGIYRFNAGNLTQQPLFILAGLTYHELIPGHHLHLASQQENETLHPFRQYSFLNAYNEGWAEYAATLAGEMGLYEQPEERYGRLVMDAFLSSRLVVDTGMNALGWSLQRARDYMRAHSGLSEKEILTESVRYACDIPGQALAYKTGEMQILKLRERMRNALAARFDLKGFHAAILGPGALPMTDLQWHVERQIERLQRN